MTQAPDLVQTLMAPVWRNSCPVFLRSEAKLRCAAAGLAAEEFRQKHDRWPKTLDELIPVFLAKVQLDPHTGEPLKLRITADGIVIFSPGPEGDLQGTTRDDRNQPFAEEHLDYEFRLWNVDQRRRAK